MYKATLIKKLSEGLTGEELDAFISAANALEESENMSLLDALMEIKDQIEEASVVTKGADKGDSAAAGTDEQGNKKKKIEKVWDDTTDQKPAQNKGGSVSEEVDDEDEDEIEIEEEEIEEFEESKSLRDLVLSKIIDEKISVEEDVNALFDGEDLSEDFKSKATTIFEAAIASKISTYKEAINEAIEYVIEEEIEAISEELTSNINKYLDYVVEEWMEQNEIAIEHGLRTEITEGFIGGLKNLFIENYIEIPEGSENILDSTIEEKLKLEEEFESQIQKNIELVSEIKSLKKAAIINEAVKGLIDTEAEKLRELAEEVRFDSADLFESKVTQLKESYFKKSVKPGEGVDNTELLAEEKITDTVMKSYVDNLGRYLK